MFKQPRCLVFAWMQITFFILISSGKLTAQSTATSVISIPVNLKTEGFVTFVIEDANGVRVRNLISNTWFKAGATKILWDGLDDTGRDLKAAEKAVYNFSGKPVKPGKYTLRGIVHKKVTTTYEFSVYSSGNPPWVTKDHKGGWLSNHYPPQAAVFVPATESPTHQPLVYLGSYIAEGADGLAWVDLNGKKIGGKSTVGGPWIAAPYLARDAGRARDSSVYVYVASARQVGKVMPTGEIIITALSAKKDKLVLKYDLGAIAKDSSAIEISGFAVNNGIVVLSLYKKNQIVALDLASGKLISKISIKKPKGLTFNDTGNLYVVSENTILSFAPVTLARALINPKAFIKSGLDNPVALTFDPKGNLYVSNTGLSNQVKVFNPVGKLTLAIGHAGAPKAGIYDPLHMNNPAGITVDSKQQLWVAENDFLPKRVSVWSLSGNFIKAFYGPQKYGGGGTVSAQNSSEFIYADAARGSMQFKLDWATGESVLEKVLYRRSSDILKIASQASGPETSIMFKGKKYYTNCYNSNPTNGSPTAFLFKEKDGVAYPIAAMGRADLWPILKQKNFESIWPSNYDSKKLRGFFIWNDLNDNQQVEVNEVKIMKGLSTGVTVMPDLSFCIARIDDRSIQFSPVRFTEGGNPVYDINTGKELLTEVLAGASTGGGQVLKSSNGWAVVTLGTVSSTAYSLSGAQNGILKWSYPDLWPGLHAAHHAPLPTFPGELIGTTRLLGGMLPNIKSDSGPLWAINSNHGMVYIFTADGLFVTTLFEPMRLGKRWAMPDLGRGNQLDGITLGEENFWPTITETKEGNVYLVNGSSSSIVKVDGLNSIQRLPDVDITLKQKDLEKVQAIGPNSSLHDKHTLKTLSVSLNNNLIIVNGDLADWKGAQWISLNPKTTAALAVSKTRLLVAFKTGDPNLLNNSLEMPLAPFKTGGALDLMIGANNAAKINRTVPVAGDERLLLTLKKGKPFALLYKAIVSGTKETDKVPFTSPVDFTSFDRVDEVSKEIEFASNGKGNYEFSVPLSILNLKPVSGLKIKGDVGILKGDGTKTSSRVYWSNKSTTIVSDVPSEARLNPDQWGLWMFK
jgi:DNA-binding beta-propeller fold protein YncE